MIPSVHDDSAFRQMTRIWRGSGSDAQKTVNIGVINDSFDAPNNPDIAWLQERSTRPR
jgi:hypothetical protein